jgi:hypothetical protein
MNKKGWIPLHYAMKIGGSGNIIPPFLTLALDQGEWPASCSSRFTPREIAPGTNWIGGHRGRSWQYGEEKNLAPAGKWTLAIQLIVCCYTDWAILALSIYDGNEDYYMEIWL